MFGITVNGEYCGWGEITCWSFHCKKYQIKNKIKLEQGEQQMKITCTPHTYTHTLTEYYAHTDVHAHKQECVFCMFSSWK